MSESQASERETVAGMALMGFPPGGYFGGIPLHHLP